MTQQPSLFLTPSKPQETASQTRDRIMADLERRAGERFREKAAASMLKTLAEYRQTGCSGEFLVSRCRQSGAVPPGRMDDRAYGPVFARLAREKRIVKVGTCQRTRGHGANGGVIWGLAPEATS